MYGVQLDQLAAWLGVSAAGARSAAARWRQRGQADSARLGPGPPWVWLTRAGLAACGLPYAPAVPALSRLAHLRAVTAVRLALEAAPGYAAAGGYWRSERRLRARAGGRLPLREHLPDGEVHWPEEAAAAGRPRPGGGPRLGRGVLGHRGRAHPQDGAPDRGHHDRDPDPDRRLRLPGGRGPGARPPAAARPRGVRLLGRRPPGGTAGPRGAQRRPGRPGRDPHPAPRRGARRAPRAAGVREPGRRHGGDPGGSGGPSPRASRSAAL